MGKVLTFIVGLLFICLSLHWQAIDRSMFALCFCLLLAGSMAGKD